MAEIRAILKTYDCAAAVTLCSTSHTEYLYEIDPSWSCAFLETIPNGKPGEFGIRIRSKRADFPSKEAQKATNEATVGMFLAIRNQAELTVRHMDRLIAMVSKVTDISHWERDER